MGYIYAIGESENSPVKIGFTTGGVFKRLAAIQIGHHKPLRVLAVAEVADERIKDIERHLHLTFRKYLLRGEWFAVTMTQESFEELIKGITVLLDAKDLLIPTSQEDTPDDSGGFLVPDYVLVNSDIDTDDHTPQLSYTYGPEDQEVKITIDGPNPSEALTRAQRTIAQYLGTLS
jgi:Meiotically up-regulated gene 113